MKWQRNIDTSVCCRDIINKMSYENHQWMVRAVKLSMKSHPASHPAHRSQHEEM